MDFYITPDEYAEAEENGVDPFNLERRIRLLGWPKQKAITTPLRKLNTRKKWAEIAESNGIKYPTFMSRITIYKWSPERAATEPLQNKKAIQKMGTDAGRRFPKDLVLLAEKNGIAYHTFVTRVNRGWDPMKAATTPTISKSEAGKRGKRSTIEKYGDWNKYSIR